MAELGGHSAVLRFDEATYVDMLIIRCVEEEVYTRRLAVIVRGNLDLGDTSPVTQSLDHV